MTNPLRSAESCAWTLDGEPPSGDDEGRTRCGFPTTSTARGGPDYPGPLTSDIPVCLAHQRVALDMGCVVFVPDLPEQVINLHVDVEGGDPKEIGRRVAGEVAAILHTRAGSRPPTPKEAAMFEAVRRAEAQQPNGGYLDFGPWADRVLIGAPRSLPDGRRGVVAPLVGAAVVGVALVVGIGGDLLYRWWEGRDARALARYIRSHRG